MALSLSLGEPRRFRFGPVFLLSFNGLSSNPAKTQSRVPNDIVGNIDRTRGRRADRDACVSRRISWVGSHPILPTKPVIQNIVAASNPSKQTNFVTATRFYDFASQPVKNGGSRRVATIQHLAMYISLELLLFRNLGRATARASPTGIFWVPLDSLGCIVIITTDLRAVLGG